jgi:hypothetical protein
MDRQAINGRSIFFDLAQDRIHELGHVRCIECLRNRETEEPSRGGARPIPILFGRQGLLAQLELIREVLQCRLIRTAVQYERPVGLSGKREDDEVLNLGG